MRLRPHAQRHARARRRAHGPLAMRHRLSFATAKMARGVGLGAGCWVVLTKHYADWEVVRARKVGDVSWEVVVSFAHCAAKWYVRTALYCIRITLAAVAYFCPE